MLELPSNVKQQCEITAPIWSCIQTRTKRFSWIATSRMESLKQSESWDTEFLSPNSIRFDKAEAFSVSEMSATSCSLHNWFQTRALEKSRTEHFFSEEEQKNPPVLFDNNFFFFFFLHFPPLLLSFLLLFLPSPSPLTSPQTSGCCILDPARGKQWKPQSWWNRLHTCRPSDHSRCRRYNCRSWGSQRAESWCWSVAEKEEEKKVKEKEGGWRATGRGGEGAGKGKDVVFLLLTESKFDAQFGHRFLQLLPENQSIWKLKETSISLLGALPNDLKLSVCFTDSSSTMLHCRSAQEKRKQLQERPWDHLDRRELKGGSN